MNTSSCIYLDNPLAGNDLTNLSTACPPEQFAVFHSAWDICDAMNYQSDILHERDSSVGLCHNKHRGDLLAQNIYLPLVFSLQNLNFLIGALMVSLKS